MNELEQSLFDEDWRRAGRLLSDEQLEIKDYLARNALARLLKSEAISSGSPGRPRKTSAGPGGDFWEMGVVFELDRLIEQGWKKEAAKIEAGNRFGLSRATVESLDRKYKDRNAPK